MKSRRANVAGYALAACALGLSLVSSGEVAAQSPRRTCWSAVPTIEGTRGNDRIRGTRGNDVIMTFGGKDRVMGRGGFDAICSGPGRDVLHGGPGSDAFETGAGRDVAYGGEGLDIMVEFTSDRFLAQGQTSRDNAEDRLHGGPQADLLFGEGGDDVLDGGRGRDGVWALTSNVPVVIDLSADQMTSAEYGVDSLLSIENGYGSNYADLITGDGGRNFLWGADGSDTLQGGDGPDLLLSSIDGDTLDGGDDSMRDAVRMSLQEPTDANLQTGVIALREGGREPDRTVGIEDFIGSPFADTITGSSTNNRLFGGGGNDYIDGAQGDDVLRGDGPFHPWFRRPYGKDFRGNDLLFGAEGDDRLDGGPKNDTCRTGETLRRCEQGESTGSRSVEASTSLASALSVHFAQRPLPWWAYRLP